MPGDCPKQMPYAPMLGKVFLALGKHCYVVRKLKVSRRCGSWSHKLCHPVGTLKDVCCVVFVVHLVACC